MAVAAEKLTARELGVAAEAGAREDDVHGDGDHQEAGSHGMGGREGFGQFVAADSWHYAVDEALRQALVNLSAVPAPA